MIHLGDITQINGAEIEPVDCITFGSPCQDLSVANGKRAGLSGERSGLFTEAIRIIKEMRENDRRIHPTWTDDMVRPKFAIWENVPGAFSSNKGEDFRCVLEEFVHIVEPTADVPRPDFKWTRGGTIVGETWSIAWRLFDAQHWGVPQRRKRIALIMDFRGHSAGEILFERTSVSGNTEPGIEAWQGVANPPEGSLGECDSFTLKIRGGVDRDSNGRQAGKGALIQHELSATMGASQDQTLFG